METRLEKHNTSVIPLPTRTSKNKELYAEIGKYEIDKFDLESNAKILGKNNKTLDVEQIKKILDTRYNETPKRKSIKLESEEEVVNKTIEETQNFDINAVLEKAKNEKNVDYESERLKKIRDTQFDILKSLEIEKKIVKKEDTAREQELINLINTITAKEVSGGDNPLDILADLKGSDKTEVVPGIMEKTTKEIKIPSKEEQTENNKFYSTESFTKSDFDDFIDLKKEVKSNGIVLKIVIGIIILAVIIGFVFFLNKFLDLGLF